LKFGDLCFLRSFQSVGSLLLLFEIVLQDEVKSKEKTIMKYRVLTGAMLGVLLLFTASARADEPSSQSFSVQGIGFFTHNSYGNGLTQHATNTGGFLLDYRHHLRWISADISYGRVRTTEQTFTTTPILPLPIILGPGPRVLTTALPVQSDVHQATIAAVVNLPWNPHRINPYVLAGTGALVFHPTQNVGGIVPGAGTQARAVFVYGGGLDFGFTKHLAGRIEYRGLFYGRPNFGLTRLDSGTKTNTAEPSAGVVFRF
jgi:opacity protein-like surface antigen